MGRGAPKTEAEAQRLLDLATGGIVREPYQFAEPEGCTMLIPTPAQREYIRESSRDLLAKAAAWYGGRVVPVINGEIVRVEDITIKANPAMAKALMAALNRPRRVTPVD